MYAELHEVSDDIEMYKMGVMTSEDGITLHIEDNFGDDSQTLSITRSELLKIMAMLQADDMEEGAFDA